MSERDSGAGPPATKGAGGAASSMAEWNTGGCSLVGRLSGFLVALATLSRSAKCIGVTLLEATRFTGRLERNRARVAAVGAVIRFRPQYARPEQRTPGRIVLDVHANSPGAGELRQSRAPGGQWAPTRASETPRCSCSDSRRRPRAYPRL